MLISLSAVPNGRADDFYKGKTIHFVVGAPAGGGYDTYTRAIGRHLGKHILIVANHLYSVAAPDDLPIGAIFPALYFDQIVGRKEVQYDWAKFIWIGSPVTSNHLLYMRADSPYKTIDDVVKASTPPKCGASGTSSTGYYVPKLLDKVVGTKFDGRPYVLPPNTPADQDAHKTVLAPTDERFASKECGNGKCAARQLAADESVIADAKKKKLEFDPTSSQELEQLAKEVVSQPPEIVGKMRQLLEK